MARGMRSWAVVVAVVAVVGAAVVAVAATGGDGASTRTGTLQVVAAENVWGSIAAQLGGSKVSVTSIVANPSTDPHSYEPTARDARALASARLAIVNGLGYDTWASRLLDANPVPGRIALDVGALLGLKAGDNPHQWYSPASVRRVIRAIVTDYQRLDPAGRTYFAARERHFERVSLAAYDRLRAEIRRRFAGAPVGYSESIFEPLGRSLGLRLLTPYGFAKAISEGSEVGARDKQTVDAQARQRSIRVWIYNSQNATPDVQRINSLCRSRHIPVVAVTETLDPASATFEQWQVAELRGLLAALHDATGR